MWMTFYLKNEDKTKKSYILNIKYKNVGDD